MSDHFPLCLHLDARGFPCNRRTMRPLSMCSLHRPAVVTERGPRASAAEYQRKRRERMAMAGVMPGTEAA